MGADAEQRVALARRGIEAYAAGDVEAAVAFFSPDAEIYAPPGEQITSGSYYGREGFLQWAGEWNEAWESFDLKMVDVEAIGERHAVAVVDQRGVGRGSGLEVESRSGYVFELGEGDECVYFALYNDPERAFAAARAREQTGA